MRSFGTDAHETTPSDAGAAVEVTDGSGASEGADAGTGVPRGPGAGENAPAEAPLATRVHAFLDPDGVELPSSTPLFEYSVEVGQHVPPYVEKGIKPSSTR